MIFHFFSLCALRKRTFERNSKINFDEVFEQATAFYGKTLRVKFSTLLNCSSLSSQSCKAIILYADIQLDATIKENQRYIQPEIPNKELYMK